MYECQQFKAIWFLVTNENGTPKIGINDKVQHSIVHHTDFHNLYHIYRLKHHISSYCYKTPSYPCGFKESY